MLENVKGNDTMKKSWEIVEWAAGQQTTYVGMVDVVNDNGDLFGVTGWVRADGARVLDHYIGPVDPTECPWAAELWGRLVR